MCIESQASEVPRIEVVTHSPTPLSERARSAARIPTTAYSPLPKSSAATGIFAGGPPGGPVIASRPDSAWMVRS